MPTIWEMIAVMMSIALVIGGLISAFHFIDIATHPNNYKPEALPRWFVITLLLFFFALGAYLASGPYKVVLQ
jgi:hypothetical protein